MAKKQPGNGGFFQKVHAVVALIPKGEVASYGSIAIRLGGMYSGRTVGFAMRAASGGLPCHRVVNKKGEMAPGHVFGGAASQRAMLEKEGVPFLANGRIDMAKAQCDLYLLKINR